MGNNNEAIFSVSMAYCDHARYNTEQMSNIKKKNRITRRKPKETIDTLQISFSLTTKSVKLGLRTHLDAVMDLHLKIRVFDNHLNN